MSTLKSLRTRRNALMAQMYGEGATITQLSSAFNLAVAAVHSSLKSQNVVSRPTGRRKAGVMGYQVPTAVPTAVPA